MMEQKCWNSLYFTGFPNSNITGLNINYTSQFQTTTDDINWYHSFTSDIAFFNPQVGWFLNFENSLVVVSNFFFEECSIPKKWIMIPCDLYIYIYIFSSLKPSVTEWWKKKQQLARTSFGWSAKDQWISASWSNKNMIWLKHNHLTVESVVVIVDGQFLLFINQYPMWTIPYHYSHIISP